MTSAVPIVLAAAAAAVAVAPTGSGALRLDELSSFRAQGSAAPPVGAALLSLAAVVVAGPAAAVLTILAVVVAQRVVQARRRTSDADRERMLALDALALLGADLRAGREPARALAGAADIAAGETAAALAAAAAAARMGGDVPSALTVEGSAVAATMRALAACWQVCSDAGSGLAGAVERLEEGLRAAEAQRHAVAAELAGPRATAQLLAVLPVVGVGLAAALGAHPLHLLLETPVGLCCLTLGLALDGLGVLWTHRLTARALS